MSEQLSFDRKKGFIALPVEILELDLSPGAFRLLAELCRMANHDGFCWPSLAQLGERLGRSRSSVSGYIKQLRELGLITTQEQRMANGYNYRLKYQVGFWKEWRAAISRHPAQKDERSVQPAVRILKDKNQNHKNHSPAKPAEDGLDSLLKKWARCVKGEAYPLFASLPSSALINKTRDAITPNDQNSKVISADITRCLEAMWRNLGVDCPQNLLAKQADYISNRGANSAEASRIFAGIKSAWAHHWRKPPTQDQFEKLVNQSRVTTRVQKIALLKTYSRRWNLTKNNLQCVPLSDCLAPTRTGAPVSAFS